MTGRPRVHSSIDDITPYKAGDAELKGHDTVIKLASNESPMGPSPKAIAAAKAALEHLERYPDPSNRAVREAIGKVHGIDPALIRAGAGSEQLIQLLIRNYAGTGDEVLHTDYSFMVYTIATRSVGATPVKVAEPDLKVSVDALLAGVSDHTRVCIIANPGNPTGTWIPQTDLRRLRDGLPDGVLLIIDAAYAEFVDDPDYETGHALVRDAIASGADNVVATRTFSKIYGLAALRLGWCHAPAAVIDGIDRTLAPFNITVPTQAAGIAAVHDQDHIKGAAAHNRTERTRLTLALRDMGLIVVESGTNFLLAGFDPDAGTARAADTHLRNEGIIVRPVAGYGLDDHLRITIGSVAENDRLIAVMRAFLISQR